MTASTATVLVVEDESDIRDALAELLRRNDYEVLLAQHGQQALELLRDGRPVDLVLLDLWMPVLDGWSFRAEQLRDPALSRVPVVVISADVRPEARAISSDAFLPKPFDPRQLLETLERVLVESRARLLRERQAQTERFASLGRLASGMAHEINNPLSFVLSNLRGLRDHALPLLTPERLARAFPEGVPPDLEDAPDLVRESLEGAERIGRVVAEIRRFSQPPHAEAAPIDPCEVVPGALRLLATARPRAKPLVELEPVPPVSADPLRLEQVLVNLLTNAADATAPLPAETREVRVRTFTAGDECVLEISDNGAGMSEAVRQRIFDPFFSTKSEGQGMGLGLFICRSIVDGLGGRLEVEPRPEAGTVARVRLPSARAAGTARTG